MLRVLRYARILKRQSASDGSNSSALICAMVNLSDDAARLHSGFISDQLAMAVLNEHGILGCRTLGLS